MADLSLHGIINVFKPPGPTSSDIVVGLRRLLGIKRVGHLGTLDPGAAGVLPVCVGNATRLFDILIEKRKTYIAEIVFGVATATQDAFGAAVEYGSADVSEQRLTEVLPRFLGKIEQTPSVYSAIKVGGKRQYELARQGETAGAKTRSAEIYELQLLEQLAEGRFLIRVACSKGTYVRTLIHDIGRALWTYAHMGFLLRTQSGPFTIDTAITIEEIAELSEQGRLNEIIVRAEDVLAELPAVRAPRDRFIPFTNGLSTNIRFAEAERAIIEGEACRLYCGGEFLGVCVLNGEEFRWTIRLNEQMMHEADSCRDTIYRVRDPK